MIRAIKLDKDISCENICMILGQAIQDHRIKNNNDISDCILVIDIKTINDDPPKIEQKLSSPT
jgi:hypothetical protein